MQNEINGFDWVEDEIGLDEKWIMDLIGWKVKLGWMEKEFNGFDWVKNEIGLDGKGI